MSFGEGKRESQAASASKGFVSAHCDAHNRHPNGDFAIASERDHADDAAAETLAKKLKTLFRGMDTNAYARQPPRNSASRCVRHRGDWVLR
jgi:hypothetical protein